MRRRFEIPEMAFWGDGEVAGTDEFGGFGPGNPAAIQANANPIAGADVCGG